jgi:PAS domain S-box-containing protein
MSEELKIKIQSLEEWIRSLEDRNRELAVRGEKAGEYIRELEEINFLLETQMEFSPDGILIIDAEKMVRSCNRKFLEMWGLPGEPVTAGSSDKIMVRVLEQLNDPEKFYKRTSYPNDPDKGLLHDELELKDGRVIERFSCSLTGLKGSNMGRVIFFRDITQRKRMDLETENTLRKSEELYRHLFEYHPMPLLIFDPDTMRVLKVNDAAVSHYGYGKEEFESLSVLDIRPREDVDIAVKTIRSMSSSVERLGIFRHKKKDGTVILVDIHSLGITYEDKPARLVICLDVTEQIRSHAALEESEEKFRTAFMTSPDSINISRMEDGLFIDINEGFEKLTGYSRQDVIGKTSLELNIWANPEDRVTFVQRLQEEGQVYNMEALFRIKDGSFHTGLMSAKVIDLGGVSYILSVTRDITEIKIAEERIRSSLHEKEILLREIHHRVKNNLQAVSGLLSLQSSFIEDADLKERFRESENRVKAIAIMQEDLYQNHDLIGIDFALHIKILVENLLASYGKSSSNIDLDLDLVSARLLLDTAIPCSLMITELVSNALNHAFDKDRKGKIRVRFYTDESGLFNIQVSDNGKGFPEDIDFRTIKSMGMQLVCTLVEQLGGTIEMSREKGTTFSITFREYQEAGTEMY